jgi:16S rRNA G966 N2-methylase RsmD
LRGEVRRSDVLQALVGAAGPFDLAVLDPPYAFSYTALQAVLDRLAGLTRGGVIALTRPKADSTDVIPIHWHPVKALTYGDARILICRERS